jgi:CubicO group peptidase (beta-lactamase class C family)
MNAPLPDRARQIITEAVATRAFPAAVVDVGRHDGPRWQEAFGRLTYDDEAPPTTTGTVFDLASLTKVVATTSVVLDLCAHGRLSLDTPLEGVVPGWTGADRDRVTVVDVLEHTSGLTAYLPLYEDAGSEEEFERTIAALPLDYPPRTQAVYSDLGFIVLATALARAEGRPWTSLVADALGPIGLADALVFRPPAASRTCTAPTRVSPWRGRLLQGEVDDENAWALGGVAGHAGLFGAAADVAAFARRVLAEVRRAHGLDSGAGGPREAPWLGDAASWRRAVARSTVAGSSRAVGWDTMLPTSSCGTRMSATAIGHTGFTGTSLWIDWERDVYVVFLTNRVHPDATAQQIVQVRPALHDAVMQDLF